MDIADLEVGHFETDVDFNGHRIAFTFRSDVTGETLMSMGRIARSGDVEPMYVELCRLITGWDLTRRGDPLAVTVEEFGRLPAQMGALFYTAIMQAIADPNKRRPSPAGSKVGAASLPIASPSSTESSRTPSTPISIRPISSGWGESETPRAGATG